LSLTNSRKKNGRCFLCTTWLEEKPPQNYPQQFKLCCNCSGLLQAILEGTVSREEVYSQVFREVFGYLADEKIKALFDYVDEMEEKVNKILNSGHRERKFTPPTTIDDK